jgi:DNA-binding NarL/FixJ family response regulator
MSDMVLSRVRPTLRFPERTRRSYGRDFQATEPQRSDLAASDANRISIAVVHHNAIVREGLSLLMSAQPDIHVVASCDGDLAMLRDTRPDVVLLSIGSQDTESVRSAANVLTAISHTRVVVVAPLGALAGFASLVQAGAYAFVLDDASPEELLRTVRSVADGARVWPPATVEALLSQLARESAGHAPSAHAADSRMTRREREVMSLIADGLSTKEIARQLGIACFTVRAHVRNIMEKLHMHSRLQIAAHVHRERQGQPAFTGSTHQAPAA